MTIEELDRLQRDVEGVVQRRASSGSNGATAFGDTVVFFRRLVGVARKEMARGSEVEARTSSGLRTLAAMLLERPLDGPPGRPAEGALADGSGLLVWPRVQG